MTIIFIEHYTQLRKEENSIFVVVKIKIVAAFRGMHVSPAKHSYGIVTDGRTDRQTDGQTNDGQSDPDVSLCFAGDTKIN